MESLKKLFEKIHLSKIAFLDYAENIKQEQYQLMFQTFAGQLQNQEDILKKSLMQDQLDFDQLKLVVNEWMINFKNVLLLDDDDILEKALHDIQELILSFESIENHLLNENMKMMMDELQIMKHQLHKSIIKTGIQSK